MTRAPPFPRSAIMGMSQPAGLCTTGRPHSTRSASGQYNATVTRFAIDKTGWDYYVGGYAYGDRNNGYVVYLGGHSYASCGNSSGSRIDPELNKHPLTFEFRKDISNEVFTLRVKYNGGQTSEITFSKADVGVLVGGAGSLRFDLTTAWVDKKIIEEITFENTSATPLTIESITVLWTGGASRSKAERNCRQQDRRNPLQQGGAIRGCAAHNQA